MSLEKNVKILSTSVWLLLAGSLYGQFGKNKVVSSKVKWEVLKTAHFDIHYDRKNADVARLAGEIAEEASDMLSRRYQYELSGIVPIIIYNSTAAFANNNLIPVILGEETGGFTEYDRNRVVVPYTGRLEEFRHVLVHEIGHAFQFDIIRNISPSSVLSRTFLQQAPLWVMEGMCEHFALGKEKNVEMYERDGIISGYLPSLPEMNNPYALGSRYYYVYKGGHSFFNWLSDEKGEEAVSDYFYRLIHYRNPDRASEEVFGLSLQKLSEKWHQALKKKYWPQIRTKEEGHINDEKLTDHGNDRSSINLKPIFGETDRYLYFFSNKKIYPQLVKFDLKKKRIVKVIASAEKNGKVESLNLLNNNLSMNKKRSLLLFVSRRGYKYYFNLYHVKRKRIIKRYPLRFRAIFQASLSPDGKRVVFSGTRRFHPDLFLYDLSSRKITPLTRDSFVDLEPAWSPDGKTIAFSSSRGFSPFSFKRSIYLYDLPSRSLSRLSTSDSRDQGPAWSSSGDRIVFSSDRNGGPDLFIKEIASGALRQITDLVGGATAPGWSPDDGKICYNGFNRGGFDIFITEVKTNEELQVESGENATPAVATYEKEPISEDSSPAWLNYPSHYDAQKAIPSKYRPQLLYDQFDILVGGSTAAGLGARITLGLADLLKNYRLYLDTDFIYSTTLRLYNTDTSLLFFNLKNRLQSGFSFRFYRYNFLRYKGSPNNPSKRESYYIFIETQVEAGFFFRYPFDKYNRLDFFTVPTYFQRRQENIDEDYFQLTGRLFFPEITAGALVFRLAYVHDSTLHGLLHPVDNQRTVISLDGGPPLGGESLRYLRFFTDLRKYFFITRYASFAFRIMGGHVYGENKNEFRFYIGGPAIHPNYPYIRGYRYRAFSGTTMYLVNVEYRTVLLDFARFAFPFPFRVGNIRAVIFLDAGSAFDDVEDHQPWKSERGKVFPVDLRSSFGFGFRFLLAFIPFKFDFSSPITRSGLLPIRKWNFFFSLGFDF